MKFYVLPLLLSSVLLLTACGKKKDTQAVKTELKTATKAKKEPTQKSLVSLTKITDGVWLHTSSQTLPGSNKPVPSNGLVVRDGEELILVNTAWGELATVELKEKLEEMTGLKVSKLVINHFHMDGLAGVDWLETQNVQVFAHPETAGLSAKRGTPVPDTSVPALGKQGARVKIGPLEVSYPGESHTKDHLMVYVTGPKILFGGCAVRPRNYNSPGNVTDANLTAWPDSLKWTKQIYPETKMTIPSHGNPEAGTALIDHTLKVLKDAENKNEK